MSRLDKLNLSKDELGRFQKAMDDPKFRALLKEYADEISNPANKAEQEAYLREVEERAREEEKAKAGASKPAAAGAGKAGKTGSKAAAPKPAAKAEPKPDPRATPSHQLVHRGFYDMTAGQMSLANESTGALAELMANRPKELVLKITLPLLERVADVNLDQSAQHVLLSSQHYYLSLPLPYPVEADAGRAAWSSKTKTLTVTMRVAPASEAELAAYLSQRQGYDALVAQRESARKEEERKEEEQAQAQAQGERIAKLKEEEEGRRRASAPALSSASTTAASSIPSPTAAAAATAASATVMPPSSLKSTSPTNSSSSSRGSSPKQVRFTLNESEGFIVPERDGPHGPKPVGLLSDHAIAEPPKPQGKGHRKKHVPGSDGPASWKGIGVEPSKSIRAAFPPEAVGPASPPSLPTSPRVGPNSSPRVGPASSPRHGPAAAPGAAAAAASQRLWPAYTYNQSAVSVVLVIKIKSIAADSVKLLLEDGPGPIGADGTAGAPSTRADLYFSTTTPRRHYRLFLPLSHAINIAKSNHTCTAANLIVNLMKLPAAPATDGADAAAVAAAAKNEWQQLLDYSVLGEFDAEGTPMSSPASAPVQGGAAAGGGLEELTLGTTAQAHEAELAAAALVQEVEGLTLEPSSGASAPATPAPVVALQPLPTLATGASTMLNPLVAAAASATTAAAAAPPAFTAPSNSLLFQLD